MSGRLEGRRGVVIVDQCEDVGAGRRWLLVKWGVEFVTCWVPLSDTRLGEWAAGQYFASEVKARRSFLLRAGILEAGAFPES